MKKIYLLLFCITLSFISISCSTKKLEGNWETVALIQDNQPLNIEISSINFVLKDKKLKAKGCAGVNLFNADITTKGHSFKATNMENTGFMGLRKEMDFENVFFDVLMNADYYKIEKDILHISSPSKNLEIQLKRK